jgi:Protein of unknown function (DUF2971)
MARTVPEAHAELLHYTSVTGLLGILESDSLRATNAAFLNDYTELSLFFERRLAKILEAGISAELAADPRLQVLPQFASTPQQAETAISQYANGMADTIRITTERFNEPYLTCFSAPANDRVLDDGLLSQWRGYGKDGGYALVFDSRKLEELLKNEASSFWYQHAQWGDVHYYQDDDDMASAEPEIHAAEGSLRAAIGRYVKKPDSSELESTFEPIATLACLYKHWGFHEESEVRIVAIPPNEELIREGRATGELRPVRPRNVFTRGGTPVPYLDLFAPNSRSEAFRLPVQRVIVGPHPQSQLRRQAVEQVLRTRGVRAEVVVSQIPYIGG